MGKSFKCGVCKQTKSDVVRYQCVRHKAICKDHVTWLRPQCTECYKDVVKYEYNPARSRWERDKAS
jgi:hypothetical protein